MNTLELFNGESDETVFKRAISNVRHVAKSGVEPNLKAFAEMLLPALEVLSKRMYPF